MSHLEPSKPGPCFLGKRVDILPICGRTDLYPGLAHWHTIVVYRTYLTGLSLSIVLDRMKQDLNWEAV